MCVKPHTHTHTSALDHLAACETVVPLLLVHNTAMILAVTEHFQTSFSPQRCICNCTDLKYWYSFVLANAGLFA